MMPSDFIKNARKKLNLTQAQFASLIGKKRLCITGYETGRSIPPGDVVLNILKIISPHTLCALQQHSEAILRNSKKQGSNCNVRYKNTNLNSKMECRNE